MIPNSTFWSGVRDAAFEGAPWAVYSEGGSTSVNRKTGAVSVTYTQKTVQILTGPEQKMDDGKHVRLFRIRASQLSRQPRASDKITFNGDDWYVMSSVADQRDYSYTIEAQKK